MQKVSVNIVTWNARRYLPAAFESLDHQSFKDFSILVIDNGSVDGTIEWLKEFRPQVKIVQNKHNRGFAGGHNQGIHFSKSDYVLVMNQDAILGERYIEELVAFMDAHPKTGSVAGAIYRLSGAPEDVSQKSFTKTVDSLGIKAHRSRRFTEVGAGKVAGVEINIPEHDTKVFGVSGAIPCFRRSALEDVRILNEYFDEDFNSYKEDVDIAWRLQLRGWSSYIIPSAVAHHFRSAGDTETQGNIATLKNRPNKSARTNLLSTRNHLWTLIKNDQPKNFWRHLFPILWYEVKKWGIVLLFEQKTLKGLWQFFKGLPKMIKKRRVIQQRTTVSADSIRTWFN